LLNILCFSSSFPPLFERFACFPPSESLVTQIASLGGAEEIVKAMNIFPKDPQVAYNGAAIIDILIDNRLPLFPSSALLQ
jgi:hypothetical protein